MSVLLHETTHIPVEGFFCEILYYRVLLKSIEKSEV